MVRCQMKLDDEPSLLATGIGVISLVAVAVLLAMAVIGIPL